MISRLELQHIIEVAFLPTECICSIHLDNSMTIQLLNPDTRKEELTVLGIDATKLATSHAIATLVAELKEEARMRRVSPSKMHRRV